MGDVEEIRQLKYRYVRYLDTKQWDEFASCFTETATADYAGLAFDSPERMVAYMRENLGADLITMHHLHHPEIEIASDDTAIGRWYLHDRVISDAYRFVLEGAAFYEDRYVRTLDGWRIEHTGYERTYEMTWSLDDVPSLKVKG